MTTHIMPTRNANDNLDGLLLPGLDGTNPLGFLAALGVTRMLTDKNGAGQVHMKWTSSGGTLVPMIHVVSDSALDQDMILNGLCDGLANNITNHPAQILDKLKTNHQQNFTEIFKQCDQTGANDRMRADWLAAVASNVTPADAINQLQTARRDYYFKNLQSVIEKTTRDHLRRVLFCPWNYSDPLDNQSLHIDPSEDRRHAHQWNKPSGDPDRKKSGGVLGANRLAIEAIPLFTSLPEGDTLRTIGFTGTRSTDTRWTWPLWSVDITLPVIRSLLLLRELQQESPKRNEVAAMRERGIVAVFRTRRILVGKTPNFTPAQCIYHGDTPPIHKTNFSPAGGVF